jgi:hypothetical protein
MVRLFFIVLPSGHPLGETLDMIFWIGDGTHKVLCSFPGFFFGGGTQQRDLWSVDGRRWWIVEHSPHTRNNQWMWAVMVDSLNTPNIQGTSDEPLWFCLWSQGGTCTPLQACHPSPMATRLSQRFNVDQVDATIFCEQIFNYVSFEYL